MNMLTTILTGGFLKGYRTQVIAVSLIVNVIVQYVVGDIGLVDALKAHWAEIAGTLGLITAANHEPKV